jgi:alanine racemase
MNTLCLGIEHASLPGVMPRIWSELDLDALCHNARAAARLSGLGTDGKQVQMMAVLKANAYGQGNHSCVVANALQKVDHIGYFGIVSLVEGVELLKGGVTNQIFNLTPSLPEERKLHVELGIVPTVSSIEELRAYNYVGERLGRRARVCLDIDTGMGRIGVHPSEVDRVGGALQGLQNVDVMSFSTHFASADEDPDFTNQQIEQFHRAATTLRTRHDIIPRVMHIANSAGISYMRGNRLVKELQRHSQLVLRPGLFLLGISPSPEYQSLLKSAVSWHSRVVLVRTVPPGTSISYGGTFVTSEPWTKLATVSVGYADGFSREYGSGYVLIRGKKRPIVGRVTMDLIVVDVSDDLSEDSDGPCCGPVETGDVVTLVGTQGDESVTLQQLADWGGTIPWEVLTRLGSVPRNARVYRSSMHGHGSERTTC